jgi:Fuc2NAc and GlcNAc transferase
MTIAALLAFGLALLGTWLLIHFAPQLHLIDRPNERSSHLRPTPRGGGIALVVAVLAGAVALPGPLPLAIRPALVAALPIAIAGLVDDRYGLSARVRFGIHLLAALGCALSFTGPVEIGLPRYLLLPLAVLAIVWGTNLFNFMDGIDGIAGAEGLFIAGIGGALLADSVPPVAAALWIIAAACAGFLIWNWAPARIFMGDVGSGFFGFLLAAIAALTVMQGLLGIPVWLILWGTFIADTGVTLARRMLRGEQWWNAHRTHAYQRLSRRFGSHAKSALLYAAINVLVLAPAATLAHLQPAAAWWICIATVGALVLFAWRAGAGTPD